VKKVSFVRVGETNRNVVVISEEAAVSNRKIRTFGYIVDGYDGYQEKRGAKKIALGDTILNREESGDFVLNPNH